MATDWRNMRLQLYTVTTTDDCDLQGQLYSPACIKLAWVQCLGLDVLIQACMYWAWKLVHHILQAHNDGLN